MRGTNFLARIFDWFREVIEAAETPFAKFAIFILPILSPIVPASVTGLRLTTELNFHPTLSAITAVVLELIGYVGAIAFIRAIYQWFRKEGAFLSVSLNGLAYVFYVFAMYEINVRLGSLAGDSQIVNQVFALLSFITIPTGLLAAEHLNDRASQEERRTLRAERRGERMEREQLRVENERLRTEQLRLQNEQIVPNVRRTIRTNGSGANNEKRTNIERFVRSVQQNEQRTPGPSEIAREVGVAKSYASDTLKIILQEQAGE
jgi:hypothetical protein